MGLGVIRSLGRRGVPVIAAQFDKRDVGQHSRYVVETVRLARPDKEEERFIEGLEGLGGRYPGALLVPAHDAAVVAMARHRWRLGRLFVVACPDEETVSRYIDKDLTYRIAGAAGIPVPSTMAVEEEGDLDRAIVEFTFPVLAKPRQSHLFVSAFGRKMVAAADADQLVRTVRSAWAMGLDMLVQEIIPGGAAAGANYNAYIVDGAPVAEFTARKVRNSPALWGSPCVLKSEVIEDLIGPGRRALGAIGLEGFACTEWRRDVRDGTWKLIEINGRHNLSSALAPRCGVDFPWIEYRHRVAGVLESGDHPYEQGRYWTDLLRDLGSRSRAKGVEKVSVTGLLSPYLSRHVGAHWAWDDPLPGLARAYDAVRHGRRSAH